MGLQNGIILMIRKIDSTIPLYINGNHFQEQIIFKTNGQLEEGLNQHQQNIQKIIKLANSFNNSNLFNGGIIYVHSNIPENCFHYRQIFYISLFLGICQINELLNTINISQLIRILSKYDLFGDEKFLNLIFGLQNKKFTMMVGDNSYKIPFQSNLKLMLCQLDLAKQDILFQKQKRKYISEEEHKILNFYKQNYNINSLLEVFQNQQQLKIPDTKQLSSNIQQGQISRRFISNSLEQLRFICSFSQQRLGFQDLVTNLWHMNSQKWNFYPKQVLQLINFVQEQLPNKRCMLVNESYCLSVTEKLRYTNFLQVLRQKIHKGQLKSKSLFSIEQQLIQDRWNSDKGIGEKLFTSVPCCGISIFDPSSSIWFD